MSHFTSNLLLGFRAAILLPLFVSSMAHAQKGLFDTKALSTFGTRTYKSIWIDRSSGAPVEHDRGTMTFSAAVTKEAITLKNVTRMGMPDGKTFIEFKGTCILSADGKFTLREMNGSVGRSDGVVLHEIKSVVQNGTITLKYSSNGKTIESKDALKDGAVPDLAVFFLVPQLPRKKGKSVKLDMVIPFPTNNIRKPESRTITCVGPDPDASTDKQTLTKFTNVKKGKKAGITYWVDDNGVLQRVLLNSDKRLDLVPKGK